MPFDWEDLTTYEKIELVLGNIDGLDDEDREEVLTEWGGGDYSHSPNPQASAFADLQSLAVQRLLAKQGRPRQPKMVRLALDRDVPKNEFQDQ